MGLILFIIAVVFTTFFTVLWIPYSIIWHIVTFQPKSGLKKLNKYFYQLAIIVDVFGNESLETLFNKIMIKGHGKFLFGGDDRDTISYVIAVNKRRGTLTRFGRFWGWFLNTVDKDHLDKAIANKINRYESWQKE